MDKSLEKFLAMEILYTVERRMKGVAKPGPWIVVREFKNEEHAHRLKEREEFDAMPDAFEFRVERYKVTKAVLKKSEYKYL
jgi:hypothetical protein